MKNVAVIVSSLILGIALSGCGGGSSSGGDQDLGVHITTRLFQLYLDNPNFQPNQAEIACAQALPSGTDHIFGTT